MNAVWRARLDLCDVVRQRLRERRVGELRLKPIEHTLLVVDPKPLGGALARRLFS